MSGPIVRLSVAFVLSLVSTAVARAQSPIFAPSTVTAVLDTRLAAADGERSWIDGGFGKGRYGDESGPRLAEAGIAWRPRFSDSVDATVSVEAQGAADPTVDVSEAYVRYRGPAGSVVRLSARAGLYWPQISLEHDGPLWTVADTITPSAINSWVGEELKIGGAEATFAAVLHGQTLSATMGGIGYGDTAGTLLSFRGWALHDLKNTASSLMPLPPLSAYMAVRQRPASRSLGEIDGRVGLYGRLEWRPAPGLMLDLFRYDNRGDRTSVSGAVDWSWDTRFTEAGLDWAVDSRTHIRAQALQGVTLMGYPDRASGEIWVDVGYASAYVAATRDIGPGAVTARLDGFRTDDHSLVALDNNDERGWAGLVAYRWDLRPGANLVFEWLRIDSDRPSRVLAGEEPHQIQTVVQTAIRFDL